MIDSNMTRRPNLQLLCRGLAARIFAFVLAACVLAPGAALAQDDEDIAHDARLDGYATNVLVESDSTALSWLLLVFLAAVAIGVMFMNAKRTHLD